MEIVQLRTVVWTAAGLRRAEVVRVKGAVVWIDVYSGKPAVAALPACYLKFLNTTTNTLWWLLLKGCGESVFFPQMCAHALRRQLKAFVKVLSELEDIEDALIKKSSFCSQTA